MTDALPTAHAIRPPRLLGRRIAAAALSLFLIPGAGHLLVGRRRAALGWLISTVVLLLLVRFTFWSVPLVVVARLVCAIEVGVRRAQPERAPRLAGAMAIAVATLFVGLGLRTLLRTSWAEAFKIPSQAMEPTLSIGDHIMVDKLAYRRGDPARGEVAVYLQPERRIAFVSRIVALGGDTVELRCGVLRINGVAATLEEQGVHRVELPAEFGGGAQTLRRLRERVAGMDQWIVLEHGEADDFQLSDYPVLRPGAADACAAQAAFTVPAGRVFVMSDNRDNAVDSRQFGPIPVEDLIGPVAYRWWGGRFGAL